MQKHFLERDTAALSYDICIFCFVDDDKVQLHLQLCASIDQTPIHEILKEVDESFHDQFYKKYLYDFVRLAHRSDCKNKTHAKKEYEVS